MVKMSAILDNLLLAEAREAGTYFDVIEAKQDIITSVGQYLRPIERNNMIKKIDEAKKINSTISRILPGETQIGHCTVSESTGFIYVHIMQMVDNHVFIFDRNFDLVKHIKLIFKDVIYDWYPCIRIFPFKNGTFMLACEDRNIFVDRAHFFSVSIEDSSEDPVSIGNCFFMFDIDIGIGIMEKSMILTNDESHIICTKKSIVYILNFKGEIVKYLTVSGAHIKLVKFGDLIYSCGMDFKGNKTTCCIDHITFSEGSWIVKNKNWVELGEKAFDYPDICCDPITGKIFFAWRSEGHLYLFNREVNHLIDDSVFNVGYCNILFNGNVICISRGKIHLLF